MQNKIITLLLIIFSLNVSAQSGITWNTGMNIATSASGNDHPRIVTNAAGNPLVLWGHSNRVLFSRWNGTAFTTPVMLNPTTMTIAEASWMGPDIAAHGDTIYVVFKQTPEASDTCHIYCVYSYNGGISFSAPVKVDNIADSISRFPTITTDDLGNPVIGFMKFDASFAGSRWVVVKSADFGKTFSMDVKASGWSSLSSTVCDCCPGSIVCSGSTVAMLYRDNNNNIRDSWAGISANSGISFTKGMGIDKQNWFLQSCPASGPDGVIIGDTLYAAFMNGTGGMNKVYFNKSSIAVASGSTGIPLTGNISGLTQQNYPRIAGSGKALAIVWNQIVNGSDQCLLRFTNNIANGFPAAYDTVDLNDITNADIALTNKNIFAVWEDDNTGTIKYRSGTYTPVNTIVNEVTQHKFSIYPNPVADLLNIQLTAPTATIISIADVLGHEIFSQLVPSTQNNIQLNTTGWNNGIYFITLQSGNTISTQKICKGN